MPSSGQLLGDEGREPIPPAIPEGGIREVKHAGRRANVVRLLLNGFQERKLRRLASVSARLFNEVTYERRQQFFHGEKVDFEGTWDKYYERYKGALGVNAQAVLQKNNEAWSSFFSLLKRKREGKLPPHMKRVGPPKYWKDGETKERKLLLVSGRADILWTSKITNSSSGLQLGNRFRWQAEVARQAGQAGDTLRRGEEGLVRLHTGGGRG